MKAVYALLWRSTSSQAAFDAAVPSLLAWLRGLKRAGVLRGCGGFANIEGGLTLIDAASFAEALAIAEGSPQASLGDTEVLEWEVYDAELKVEGAFPP
jgi:uncharacterized protein YciI